MGKLNVADLRRTCRIRAPATAPAQTPAPTRTRAQAQPPNRALARQAPESRIQVRERPRVSLPPLQYASREPVQASNGNGLGGADRCITCQKQVFPFVNRMMTDSGAGPYCKECWAHAWVSHPFANAANAPACSMGVRFTDREWAGIQGLIQRTIQDTGGRYRRFPSAQEIDAILATTRLSRDCPACHAPIVFTLRAEHLNLPGITTPWPQNQPPPWIQTALPPRR